MAENVYLCNCRIHFAGDNCETQLPSDTDPCESTNLCWHDGVCRTTSKSISGFYCDCTDYWTGTYCDEDIDECTFGGTTICRNNATCLNYEGQYTCLCKRGWTGKTCQADRDECDDPAFLNPLTGLPNPCQAGTCINTVGGFECDCPEGLGGELCERPATWCDSGPCGNNALCHIILDKISCTCNSLTTGTYCEVYLDGRDPNLPPGPCNPSYCENKSQCVEDSYAPDGYECICQPKFKGRHCEERVPQCKRSSCKNQATCKETWDYPGQMPIINPDDPDSDQLDFHCICKKGFSGTTCETNDDDCFPDPCHGFKCIDYVFNFECECKDSGYTGYFCEEEINECLSSPCHMHYSVECLDEINEYKCVCNCCWGV